MLKSMKKIIVLFSGILILTFIFSVISYSSVYMYRILRYGESDINDYKIFPVRTIESSAQPFYYEEAIIDNLEESIILNFRTIDFAKIGSMLLHKGKWNGEDIISESWINKSTLATYPLQDEDYKNTFLGNTGDGYIYVVQFKE